ncbi:MAG: hypothetical protein WCG19_03140 [Chlorobiaceae bacterium]
MGEVELVDKVRILHVALLWAMNNYFPWHHNEPPFSEKDRHALVLFIQNDAFTFTRCNAETIKSYLQSDFHLYGLSRSALMGYSDSLKSVITADQLNRHTDNPYLFEFPEKETPFVKEFFDCRAAFNWVESLREKPQKQERIMGDFKTDLNKRNLLISAFHERKNYCENWILRIEAELQDETLNEKAISKKMIGLEAWKNLHPVIEKYTELSDDWDKLHFPELWKIVTGDRELADVVYNGIRQLKSNIIERRDSAGLPVLHKDMKDLAYGRDSKDYQEWNLLNELENRLREAYRQDQPQISKAEDRQGAEPVEGAPKNEIPLPDYIKNWGGGSLTGLVGLKHFRDDMQLILTQGFTVRTLAAKEYWARYEKEFLNKGKKEKSFIEAVKSNLQLDNIFPRPRRSKNEAKKND